MSTHRSDCDNAPRNHGRLTSRALAACISVALLTASIVSIAARLATGPSDRDGYVAHNLSASRLVSFDLIDNRIFVKIYLDGKGPFNFIFDTGADAVITPEVASILGLSVTADGTTSGVGNKSVATGQAPIGDTRLGDYSIQNYRYSVLTIDGTREVFGTVPVDGIIGLPFFEQYAVKIDYVNKTLNFQPGISFQYRGSGAVIPFTRLDEIPTIRATLDGIPGEFDVDTGARSSLILFAHFIERFGLRTKYSAHIEGITGWGIGGPVRSQLARAGQFRIGNVVVKWPILRLTTQKSGLTATLKKAGLIGPGILRQFDVTFDYAHKRMILEPNTLYGVKDSYDRTGLWLGQDGSRFKVLNVMASSPASDQGFKTGDEILSIDGVPTEKLSLPSLRTSFQDRPPGTVVHMMVLDENGVGKRTLILRDLV